jgi:hypothetical protein
MSHFECQHKEFGVLIYCLYFGGRYCLYSRWKNDTYQQHAKLLRKRGEAQKKIKSIMKRVSKENIKPVGRLIGKLTHCSPGFLFDYVRMLKCRSLHILYTVRWDELHYVLVGFSFINLQWIDFSLLSFIHMEKRYVYFISLQSVIRAMHKLVRCKYHLLWTS